MSKRKRKGKKSYVIQTYGEYVTVNKAADRVAKQTGMDKELIRQIVKAFLHEMIKEIALHKRIYLPGIALFNPIVRAGMTITTFDKSKLWIEPKKTYNLKIHPLIEMLMNPQRKQNAMQKKLLQEMDRRQEKILLYSKFRARKPIE